jgi:tryptophanyl-tRNA synthetase
MITPLAGSSACRPTRTSRKRSEEKDLATYGFLGYPLLQSADILLYRAAWVPVGEDQVAHVEITREIARRFNHLFGREPGFEEKAGAAIKQARGRNSSLYEDSCASQVPGDRRRRGARDGARSLVTGNARISLSADRERLLGFLEGGRRGRSCRAAGAVDADLRSCPGSTARRCPSPTATRSGCARTRTVGAQKLRTMQTDPARVRRTDPGDPQKCPVWTLHEVYSDETRAWGREGCRTAGIGCLECKKPLIEKVVEEVGGMRKRAQEFEENPEIVRNIVAEGAEKARDAARATLDDVRRAMHLRVD